MSYPSWLWVTFNIFVLLLLVLDLGVFHRKQHQGVGLELLKKFFKFIIKSIKV